MELVQMLLQTDGGVAALILRITLAVVIFPHGAQKVLGWFGGHGFQGPVKYFAGSGIPGAVGVLANAADFSDLWSCGRVLTPIAGLDCCLKAGQCTVPANAFLTVCPQGEDSSLLPGLNL